MAHAQAQAGRQADVTSRKLCIQRLTQETTLTERSKPTTEKRRPPSALCSYGTRCSMKEEADRSRPRPPCPPWSLGAPPQGFWKQGEPPGALRRRDEPSRSVDLVFFGTCAQRASLRPCIRAGCGHAKTAGGNPQLPDRRLWQQIRVTPVCYFDTKGNRAKVKLDHGPVGS